MNRIISNGDAKCKFKEILKLNESQRWGGVTCHQVMEEEAESLIKVYYEELGKEQEETEQQDSPSEESCLSVRMCK